MGMPGMFDQLFTNPMSDMMGTRDYDVERGADIFASRAQLDQAHQALQQARAQIQQIDTKLRDTLSIAPFDGVIVKKSIEVGDTVQPGQPLLIYEDISELQIVADMPSRLVKSLREGQDLSARIDGINTEIEVKVSKIFPTSDPVRHTTRVKFSLPVTTDVSPGNYAEIWIPVSKGASKKRFLVPSSAIVTRGGLPTIFVVDQQNQVELRLVRAGRLLSSGDVVIDYGVSETDRVLDKPPAFVTSGYVIKQ
jgi:RND family efflux transporter MFP subunit